MPTYTGYANEPDNLLAVPYRHLFEPISVSSNA
jgi:hypothetical protein